MPPSLKRNEQARLRQELKAGFEEEILSRHPVQWAGERGRGTRPGTPGQRGGLGLSIRIPFGMMGTKLAPSLDAT